MFITFTLNYQYIGFPLGYFLLVAGKYSYFSYRVGVDGSPRGKAVFDNTRWEAITRKLGEPLGDFVKDGNVYTREFKHVKVVVDVGEMTGIITVKNDIDEKTGEKDDEEAHEDDTFDEAGGDASDEDAIEISDDDGEPAGSGDEL